jgi:hypothetical protein
MGVIAKIPRLLTCPACQKRLRWSGSESTRVHCPNCRTRFVVLVRPSGECAAVLEDDDAVAQMFADWLRPDWAGEDDDSPETPPSDPATGTVSELAPGSAEPDLTPIVEPPAGNAPPIPLTPLPDDAPTRRAG